MKVGALLSILQFLNSKNLKARNKQLYNCKLNNLNEMDKFLET